MSDKPIACFFLGCIIGTGVFVGISIATGQSPGELKREAIKRGFAEYNATTGEWQWKGSIDESRK